jgi:hypothetical protein
MKNLHQVSKGSLVTITEKLHGTSGRCGNLLVEKEVNKSVIAYNDSMK